MKLLLQKISAFTIIALSILLLQGCKDEAEHEPTCLDRLDNYEFQSVADDPTCSNYERASAELGLGKMLVENFLKEGASDNFVIAYDITASGWQDQVTHFENAQNYTSYSADRTRAETEIHLFATMARVIVETHGRMDSDLDGEVTETETQSFTKVQSTPTGSNSFSTPTYTLQLIDNTGDAILWDEGLNCIADTNYDGDTSGDSSIICPSTINDTTISQVNVITQIDDLEKIFDGTADTTSVQEPLDFLSMYTRNANFLSQDLTGLGFEEDSEIQKSLNESVEKLDNGGDCSSDAIGGVNLMSTIIRNSAPSDATDFRDYNLISSTDDSISQLGITVPDLASLGSVDIYVRLLYKKEGGDYTPFYTEADTTTSIYQTLSNLGALTLDPDTNEYITSTAGDETITLQELLCSQDASGDS